MDERTRVRERAFRGRRVPAMGPEDLLLLSLPDFARGTGVSMPETVLAALRHAALSSAA